MEKLTNGALTYSIRGPVADFETYFQTIIAIQTEKYWTLLNIFNLHLKIELSVTNFA